MKNKNFFQLLLMVAFVLILAVASYLFIRGDFTEQDGNSIQSQNPLDLEKNFLAENGKEDMKPAIILQPLEDDFNPNPYRGGRLKGSCGMNLSEFELKVSKAKKARAQKSRVKSLKISAELSELQLQAIQGVRAECQQWYDFLGTMENTALAEYEAKIQESHQLKDYFINNDASYEDKLATAKSLLASGDFDDSWFSTDALGFLLTKNHDFQRKIAEALNIKGNQYIKANTSNIVFLYNCSINYARDCAANSILMMDLCYSFPDGDMCGISYNQYIAATTTANNYMDLENIVSIIKQLIKQGYFD